MDERAAFIMNLKSYIKNLQYGELLDLAKYVEDEIKKQSDNLNNKGS